MTSIKVRDLINARSLCSVFVFIVLRGGLFQYGDFGVRRGRVKLTRDWVTGPRELTQLLDPPQILKRHPGGDVSIWGAAGGDSPRRIHAVNG